jgi:pimeloyl-ACP methyl ester carboxylesterase
MMQRRPVSFYSHGCRLDGDLYLPSGWPEGERLPALITCSGYQGLKDIHPARFGRTLAPHGYACLAFDYRSFGKSEGERGRLIPQEQAEDVRAAISFLETLPQIDPERIALIGWALGGGVVIAEAADDARVKAVVAINAIGDGARATRFMHDEASWPALLEQIADDRRRRAVMGASQRVHPFSIVRLDNVTAGYVDDALYPVKGFGSEVTLESAEFLLRFSPEGAVERLAPRPLLLVHGAENALHAPEESKTLYERAGEPKELVLLDGRGHTEWMYDDHPCYRELIRRIRPFLDSALAPAGAVT